MSLTRKYFSLFIFLYLIVSCNQRDEKVKEGILSCEKMSCVIVSLNLSESLILQNNLLRKEERKELKFNAFKENGVTYKEYALSIKYYSAHPTQLKLIYESALAKLNLMKEDI